MGDQRQQTYFQWAKEVIALLIVPLMAWMLLQTVETQKEIVALRYQVAAVAKDLLAHSNNSTTSDIHHRREMRKCVGCHEGE